MAAGRYNKGQYNKFQACAKQVTGIIVKKINYELYHNSNVKVI